MGRSTVFLNSTHLKPNATSSFPSCPIALPPSLLPSSFVLSPVSPLYHPSSKPDSQLFCHLLKNAESQSSLIRSNITLTANQCQTMLWVLSLLRNIFLSVHSFLFPPPRPRDIHNLCIHVWQQLHIRPPWLWVDSFLSLYIFIYVFNLSFHVAAAL